jgi:serine/threonine protein kinase
MPMPQEWEHRSDLEIPTDGTPYTLTLFRYMSGSMVTGFREKKFLPQQALAMVTAKEVIDRVIDDDELLDNVTEAKDTFHFVPKLFAICVYCALPMAFLRKLLQRGFGDPDLPLKSSQCPDQAHQQLFETAFLLNQSSFLVATFDLNKSMAVPSDWVVPIKYNKKIKCGKGGFSVVYPVRIHPDHQTFLKVFLFQLEMAHTLLILSQGTDLFAMKKFKAMDHTFGEKGPYHREEDFLNEIANLKHPHLVKRLASWTYEGSYYILFPLAKCNLWEHMKRNPQRELTPKFVRWFLHQMTGLAEALQTVHSPSSRTGRLELRPAARKTAYHHDIKHQNILCYDADDADDAETILRLSDFGCGKVAEMLSTVSGSEMSHVTNAKMGTPTTEAPEGFRNRTSRPYDMWSMGCVYLELLVWMLCGFEALCQFRRDREGIVSQERPTKDDRFYDYDKKGNLRVRIAVGKKFQDLREHPQCKEGVLKDFLDIVLGLFVIKPDDRPTAEMLCASLRPFKNLPKEEFNLPSDLNRSSLQEAGTDSPNPQQDSQRNNDHKIGEEHNPPGQKVAIPRVDVEYVETPAKDCGW